MKTAEGKDEHLVEVMPNEKTGEEKQSKKEKKEEKKKKREEETASFPTQHPLPRSQGAEHRRPDAYSCEHNRV